MFTGLVESVGTVVGVRDEHQLRRLVLGTDLPVDRLPLGASVSVNGACLTVVERAAGRLAFDVGPETLARTTLGRLAAGDRVHLERALAMGDALGGHLVTGHVDAIGEVVAARPVGDSREVEIACPHELAVYLVPKGSVAVDGVSLTVNSVSAGAAGSGSSPRFSVTLIPHTLAVTTWAAKQVGDAVNLEVDLIAKQVAKAVRVYLEGGAMSRMGELDP